MAMSKPTVFYGHEQKPQFSELHTSNTSKNLTINTYLASRLNWFRRRDIHLMIHEHEQNTHFRFREKSKAVDEKSHNRVAADEESHRRIAESHCYEQTHCFYQSPTKAPIFSKLHTSKTSQNLPLNNFLPSLVIKLVLPKRQTPESRTPTNTHFEFRKI